MNETEAICWIRGHVEGVNKTDYQFHPALMDAVFQVCTITGTRCSVLTLFVPSMLDGDHLEHGNITSQTFVIMEADFIAQLYDKINVGDKDRSFLVRVDF